MKRFNILLFGRKIGFTLTELLVVVIIVAILAVLALPMLVKTLEKAKVGEAASNLNLIRTGQKIYFLEYATFSPGIDDLNIESPNAQDSRYFYYEIANCTPNPDGTPNFAARSTRGGTGAIGAPEPYQDDRYIIHKEGRIRGRFISGEEDPPEEP